MKSDELKSVELTPDSQETYHLPDGEEITGAELRERILNLEIGENLPGFIGPGDEGF